VSGSALWRACGADPTPARTTPRRVAA
jgi:hypothetical protein